ncbi:Uncharacterised protein [Neisseria animalis]|nr:Uncharacterised protein [Neisseria animalis]
MIQRCFALSYYVYCLRLRCLVSFLFYSTIFSDSNHGAAETHYRELTDFVLLDTAVGAAEIKAVLGRQLSFIATLIRLPDGDKLLKALKAKAERHTDAV